MRDHQSEIERRGARLAAVGLGGLHFARTFREDTGITFPLAIDENRRAYSAVELKHANLLHLIRKDNSRRRKEAKAAGFRQVGIGKDPLQLGATFVFAPGNVDRFVHISETFSDNAPIQAVVAALP